MGDRLTGGIFCCRDSAGFRVSASNKLSCILTGMEPAVGYYSVHFEFCRNSHI